MKRTEWAAALLIGALLIGCTGNEAKPAPVVTALPSATAVIATAEPTAEPVYYNGEAYPRDSQKIVVKMPVQSFDAVEETLALLPGVQTVDLLFDRAWEEDLAAYAALAAFAEAHPEIVFSEQHPTGSDPASCRELTIYAPIAHLDALVRRLPGLETLTVPDRETAKAALTANPALRVLWNDADFGASDSAATALTLPENVSPDALSDYLALLPNVTELDLRTAGLSLEQGDALAAAYPGVALLRTVPLAGAEYDSTTESLTLENLKIDDADAFEAELARFTRLTYLDLSGCNLSDARIAALREKYPEKGIVWTVYVHGRSIRTDRVAFSSKQYKDNTSRYTTKDCQPLQYCTSLIALDLGHNAITDLEWIRPLQNLQLVIFGDNKISDISPLGDLKQLKYAELFMNKFSDISVFAGLPELLDVNLCYTKVGDLSPLLSCQKLERIWIEGCRYTPEGLAELTAAFPNATVHTAKTGGSTGAGWRDHPRYDAYIQMFKQNIAVAPFVPAE